MSERNHLQELLEKHVQNLRLLQKQKAVFAAGEVPLHLLNQIEAEEKAIASIEQQLATLDKQSSEAATSKQSDKQKPVNDQQSAVPGQVKFDYRLDISDVHSTQLASSLINSIPNKVEQELKGNLTVLTIKYSKKIEGIDPVKEMLRSAQPQFSNIERMLSSNFDFDNKTLLTIELEQLGNTCSVFIYKRKRRFRNDIDTFEMPRSGKEFNISSMRAVDNSLATAGEKFFAQITDWLDNRFREPVSMPATPSNSELVLPTSQPPVSQLPPDADQLERNGISIPKRVAVTVGVLFAIVLISVFTSYWFLSNNPQVGSNNSAKPVLESTSEPLSSENTSESILYKVSVIDSETNKPIVNAAVSIDLAGEVAKRTITGSDGLATISVSSEFAEQPSVLFVNAQGYHPYRLNITLRPHALTEIILLDSDNSNSD